MNPVHCDSPQKTSLTVEPGYIWNAAKSVDHFSVTLWAKIITGKIIETRLQKWTPEGAKHICEQRSRDRTVTDRTPQRGLPHPVSLLFRIRRGQRKILFIKAISIC